MKKLQLKSIWLFGLITFSSLYLISCGDDDGGTDLKIPVVLSFSPDSGEAGDEVTISGTDLNEASEVTFNGTPATIVSNTATEVVVNVPEDGTTGKIAVRTAGGLGVSSTDFTVITIGAVTVSSINPISGHVGEQVVITGTEMASVTAVSVGDAEATIVEVTDTSVEFTIPEDAEVGLNALRIVNEGGTHTTSTESVKFYVIESHAGLIMTFDGEQEGAFTGSPDPEESTIYGTSNDATVQAEAQALPEPVDGFFFHFEGYSSTDISGNYATIVQNSSAMPVGTYAEYLAGFSDDEIYFNVQINLGELPDEYEDVLFALRVRFEGGDYEYTPTAADLAEWGIEAVENEWINVSVPVSVFDDAAEPGTFVMTDMQRIGVVVRRNYGAGGTAGQQVTAEMGGVFYALSFDNARLSVGGPYSYED